VTQKYEGLRHWIITSHHKFHLSYMLPYYVTHQCKEINIKYFDEAYIFP